MLNFLKPLFLPIFQQKAFLNIKNSQGPLRGHRGPSGAVKGRQGPSRGPQGPSRAVRGHQGPLGADGQRGKIYRPVLYFQL